VDTGWEIRLNDLYAWRTIDEEEVVLIFAEVVY